MISKWTAWTVPLGLGLILATGCTHHTASQNGAQAEQSMGTTMQQNGLMPREEYVKVRDLGYQVASSHAISDADLDWDLAFLQRSDNGIARARALTVISEISPLSHAQKAKISPVVTPYLTSPDPLTRLYAQRVQRHGGLL